MYTEWKYPNSVRQYAEHESHVSWDGVDNFLGLKRGDGRYLKTSKDLVHISCPLTNDIRSTTWYLEATNFNFSNIVGTVTGIEVQLDAKRGGRISDETIQLCHNGQPLSDNMATPPLDMSKIYGGSTNDWNVDIIDNTEFQDVSFGVLLRFQSHPFWPHRESMLIDSVAIRFFTV